ncbi:MAG: putative nucleic acid-binding protein, contains PIN domain [Phormidesmis priestleyi Ana]|uniref:Putative nucleic acid-binding protein, contains PIN domain n=1 Tax=Phormidesmis priestleyi Ana TaxID=1666911 RepID=A0A0N8KLX5_9CYAN|nr:MAG: putative nucleic acid-binding protein, contains PIN domain [Phormidesmis priestleyi Ana]
MIIISDTSPISNLLLIGQLSLLKVLYGQLIIPDAVFQEIKALETFAIDVSGVQTADWIEVRAVCDQMLVEKLVTEVDRGEAEAIALAIELNAERLLIDERIGRRVAQRYDLKITGLLGVLVSAKQNKLIDELKPVLDQLIQQAKFRVHADLYQQILKDANETVPYP